MLDKIFWLGHSSVKITGEAILYIDPWKIEGGEEADIILVSHSHHDHLSPEDVKKIQKEGTVIVTTEDCVTGLSGDVRVAKAGDELHIGGVKVEAVPSYNMNKAFHPKSSAWIGFIVTMGGKRIYYCGDTDFIPEMREIEADIVIIPVGETYTMTADEAAGAVNVINPEAAIPIHYGDIVGSIEDAERFRDLAECRVEIKPVSR
ncbi:MAG: MBL fold metallo-hydrolase [Syntrophobacterales bacterium]|nr:MAG: MBL fold metallo-hydrolase [Syntrophobacterales bacterium]